MLFLTMRSLPRETADAGPVARGSRFRAALTYGFETLPRDIGKALLVGLILAALISADRN